MSLVALAVRTITVQLLKNATLAGARVYDSALDPIDQTKEAAPIITVSTDDDEREVEGRDVLGACRSLDLVIEMVVAQKVTVALPTEDGGGEGEVIVLQHTDANLETVLNLMGRQLDRALLVTEDGSPWSDLWRTFALKIKSFTSRRGGSTENGVKFAARQLVIRVETLAEPSFAPIEAGGPWARLLAAMRATTELVSIADLLEAEIVTPDIPEWRRVAADLGLRDYGALAIGIGPVVENPALDEETPPLVEATVTGAGLEWPLNEQTADDALGPEPEDA